MGSGPRNRKAAAGLAVLSAIAASALSSRVEFPVFLPGVLIALLCGLHKFYLGQRNWGIAYVVFALLGASGIPQVASALEAIWYLTQDPDEFDLKFNQGVTSVEPGSFMGFRPPSVPDKITAMTEAVRQLEQLRSDGLITENEFEKKRRQLVDRS
jgi:TM2 domain-containing membrane protein YozV